MDSNTSVFRFQGNNMIVHAKGPNMAKNISYHSGFRTNLMSSTVNMPRNFVENSYTESTRSLYYGRETSPTASIHSDFQPRNFHQPFLQGQSQRSTYNGRGSSPVSMRSVDSSSSVDIIWAIKNGNFSEHEWRKIHLALKSKTNNHFSRMADRRRKLKQKFEMKRRIYDNDSGEQGSNSSLSSDDSTRTGYSRYNKRYKENIPRREFRNNDRVDDVHRDYGDSSTQNPFRGEPNSYVKNMASSQTYTQTMSNNILFSQKYTMGAPRNAFTSNSVMNGHGNISAQRNNLNSSISSTKSLQNQTVMSQRDRFQNGFQFPSQRFNNSTLPVRETENSRPIQNLSRCGNNKQNKEMACLDEDSDENDNIFVNNNSKPQQAPKNNKFPVQKRNIDSLGNIPVNANKKHKAASNNIETVQQTQLKDNKKNDFVFAKPAFPVRKSAPAKTREKIISKSAAPSADTIFNDQDKSDPPQSVVDPTEEKEAELELSDSTQLTTSDMSMRPSFMKRKLFTQTLDVTERKNNSCENLATDSPQSNIYSELSKEKHKTRKLVNSQSLLSRDIYQDDNNLLDLIHKIVPPSQVTTKKPKVSVDNTAADDKWDVTSIISTCDNDTVSDTYTDDEIFNVTNDVKKNKSRIAKQNTAVDDKKKTTKPETRKVNNPVLKKCNVVVEKISVLPKNLEVSVEASPDKKPLASNSRIYAFWNTDVESDYECGTPVKHKEMNTQGTPQICTGKQSSIRSYIEVKTTPPATKQTKNKVTAHSKPLVVHKNDPTLVKTLKKQTNKQLITKPNTKITKNTKDKNPQPNNSDKVKKDSPTTIIKTRRQLSLSLLEDKTSSVKDKVISTNKKIHKESIKTGRKDKTTDKKATKMQSSSDTTHTDTKRNKKQNNSVLTEKTRKKDKTKTIPKCTDDQEATDMLCKVLRSRQIDLSSSFNSDQFELTGISRLRKSRTPIKVTCKR